MGKIQDTEKFYGDLGENIKSFRTKQGYSQDQLAKFLDLTRSSVVNIEKGRQRPPLHTVYDLAVFFDIDIKNLLPSTADPMYIRYLKSLSGDS